MIVQLDLANEASIGSAARQAGEMWGGIDILVNNAVAWTAHPAQGELFETTPAGRMREGLDANLLGPYLLARAVVGDMRARGWGRVVHISTGLVADGRAGSATYVTPKAGLHGLTRTMSRELAGSGILTNLVMAGFVVGDKAVPAAVVDACAAAAATGRTTAAEEVGRVVAFLCSAANGHVTGELIRADGHFLTPA
jgi:3-oxoacyl-[acyl-carrier protein] reductase